MAFKRVVCADGPLRGTEMRVPADEPEWFMWDRANCLFQHYLIQRTSDDNGGDVAVWLPRQPDREGN